MPLNYERIMAYRPADQTVSYGPRDCIIYALGIGLGMDPMDQGQLKFVYEKNLTAFPDPGGGAGAAHQASTIPSSGSTGAWWWRRRSRSCCTSRSRPRASW